MNMYIYKEEKPFYFYDVLFAEQGDNIAVNKGDVVNVSKGDKRITNIPPDVMAVLAQSLVESDIDDSDLDSTVTDNVNHPSHYTSHPSGVECIDITRHYCFAVGNAIKYLWRAGLKRDASLSDKQKEVEDLKKAIWYINDRIKQLEGPRDFDIDSLPSGNPYKNC